MLSFIVNTAVDGNTTSKVGDTLNSLKSIVIPLVHLPVHDDPNEQGN
ncbi:UNVERIFIED_CONTAM: hypothetical protein KB579_08765 [Streptococcus canis]|nr:hypothetical protein [Streptococcus canis]